MLRPFLVAILAVTAVPIAGAQPRPRVQWDQKGWVMLGEETVDYTRKRRDVDYDRIDVGKYEGKFNKVQLVVDDSDLVLTAFKIEFSDGTSYSPQNIAYEFKEGQRTKQLDLPPAEPLIKAIHLAYKNLPGGGKARVQVWAFKTGDVAKPQPPRERYKWDTNGWQMLGEQTVDTSMSRRGRKRNVPDTDRITVGKYEGKFEKLQLIVDDSDMTLVSMSIVFADNTSYKPQNLGYEFKENQRSKLIDLPPSEGVIQYIDLTYRNSGKPDRQEARVQVWGKNKIMPKRHQWNTAGWQMLGEETVDPAKKKKHNRDGSDTDRIKVGKYEGKFTKLQIVVDDSTMTLISMRITFADKTTYTPQNINYEFKEGQRSREIELPPGESTIQFIDLDYKNSGKRDGERARVQVWGLTGARLK